MHTVNALFEAELTRRQVEFAGPDSDGLYRVQIDQGELTVSLENITRAYERNRDPDAVLRFVEQVLATMTFELPDWEGTRFVAFAIPSHASVV